MLRRVSISRTAEHGQAAVIFAIMLPVFLLIGAIVLDVGNWYVHKRHLQSQVDAAALAPAPEFTGCFDPAAWPSTDDAIARHALGFAGDELRPGALGSSPSSTTNLQVQEPGDVRIVLNSNRYWQKSDGYDPDAPSDGYGLDKTLDSADPGTDGGFCDEGYIDVKATDEEAPLLWGILPLTPSPKSYAKAQAYDQIIAEGILPFAVPEVVPGAVAALFVNEDATAGNEIVGRALLTPKSPPSPPAIPGPEFAEYSMYEGTSTPFNITGRDDIGVIILVSKSDVTNLDPEYSSPSIAVACGKPGVRCYSGSGKQDGLALIHGYESGSGGGEPVLRQVDVSGCVGGLSDPYFALVGDCNVAISAEIDGIGSLVNFRAFLHEGANCAGSGSQATGPFVWSSTLPEPDKDTGQVAFSIGWRAQGSGPERCFGRIAARPYVQNGKSGPVLYLTLNGQDNTGAPFANPHSIPKEPGAQPVQYTVTVGLLPPLRRMTLADKPVLIRYATEDNPSLTQSIDCDVDNYPYPDPFDNMPADVAEIAHGCVTPYLENETLDCSDYSNGDLPPAAPPETTFENAPDCAQSKNGQVSSLRQGLVARVGEGATCAPNNWPDAPITQEKIDTLVQNFGDDPRLVTLVVTEFGAFSGSGNAIIPIRYFAGFYITGKDISAQSPKCDGEDPHPLYGENYKPHRDDGDVWGYWIVRVKYGSSGIAGPKECDFTTTPQDCVLTLVE